MSDHNLLNLATFDDIQRSYTVSVQPFIVEGGGTLDLGGMNNVLWIKEITWEYKYLDVGVPNARRLPVKPIEVYVADILQKASKFLPPFIEPRPVVGKVPFRVINTNLNNNHKLEVEFHLRGVLVSPRDGCEPLPLKKMKAYVMLDSSERGKLALEEASADQLDETLTQLGLGSLRDLPGGLSAIKELPAPLQMAIFQGLAAKGELPDFVTVGMPALTGAANVNTPLALPDADPQRETSVFIGDLLAALPEDLQDSFKMSQLKSIAEGMVEKGWRRV